MKKKNEVKKISLAYLSGFVVLRNYENAPFLWFEVYFFRKYYECFYFILFVNPSQARWRINQTIACQQEFIFILEENGYELWLNMNMMVGMNGLFKTG